MMVRDLFDRFRQWQTDWCNFQVNGGERPCSLEQLFEQLEREVVNHQEEGSILIGAKDAEQIRTAWRQQDVNELLCLLVPFLPEETSDD